MDLEVEGKRVESKMAPGFWLEPFTKMNPGEEVQEGYLT